MYELIAEGSFPRPVSIGLRAVAWIDDEVTEWVEAQIKTSRRQEVRGFLRYARERLVECHTPLRLLVRSLVTRPASSASANSD